MNEDINFYTSYYDFFEQNISPGIKELDIYIKTQNNQIEELCDILSITTDEIEKIMKDHDISRIDKSSIFTIASCGMSYICQLIHREVLKHSPYTYTKNDISYIYNLDFDIVSETFDALKIKEATSMTLPMIFSAIPINALNVNQN